MDFSPPIFALFLNIFILARFSRDRLDIRPNTVSNEECEKFEQKGFRGCRYDLLGKAVETEEKREKRRGASVADKAFQS